VTYAVKELFYTVQGEGANIGRPAVFIRFAGCNLWTGREKDRATAVCKFCDTDFVGGHKWGATGIAMRAHSLWPNDAGARLTVITGGEPALQIDDAIVDALHRNKFKVAIETNGTLPLPDGIDWICVSPKATVPIAIERADELKLVYPQEGVPPERFEDFAAGIHWLSPMAGPDLHKNTARAAAYCKSHPRWRLAIQAHKFWNVP
jgi:7-carboxy-7-deazaguanine synthase